jgi:ribosome-binding protein aMBF1 (putative translation factor)
MERHDDPKHPESSGMIRRRLIAELRDRVSQLSTQRKAEALRYCRISRPIRGTRMPAQNTLADSLRAAIQASGMTCYSLAAESGVSQSVLSRFLSGERDMSLETGSKLAAVLGLALQRAGSEPKPAARKPKPAASAPLPNIPRIMSQIDAAADRGALVTFRTLRPHCGLSKRAFDSELIRLAREGVVCLHRHDFPSSLKPAELRELVESDGEYFVGCAKRR